MSVRINEPGVFNGTAFAHSSGMLRHVVGLIIVLFCFSLALAQDLCVQPFQGRKVERIEEYDTVKVLVTDETLFGKRVEVRRVDNSQLIKGHMLAADLRSDDAIFIGLNSIGHMYLVANIVRYDGKLMFEKPEVNERSDVLDKGLVLRIEDKDGKLQDAIIDYLKKQGGPRSIDCTAGMCKLVSEATGIEIATNFKEQVLPHKLVQRIVEDGVRDAEGKPLGVQVFMLGNASPQLVLKVAEKVSEGHLRSARLYSAVGIGTIGLVSSVASYFLF